VQHRPHQLILGQVVVMQGGQNVCDMAYHKPAALTLAGPHATDQLRGILERVAENAVN
jgi:hypothetical protein